MVLQNLEFVINKNGTIHDRYWIEKPEVKEKKNSRANKKFWKTFLLLILKLKTAKLIKKISKIKDIKTVQYSNETDMIDLSGVED